MRSSTLAGLWLLSCVGCADGPPEVGPPDAGAAQDAGWPDASPLDAGSEWTLVEVEWGGCSLPPGVDAECTTIEVPADWTDPLGATIEVHLSRIVHEGGNPRGQLWGLAGGPGQAGSAYAGSAELFRELMPELDLYMLDFRGTGAGAYLDCTAELERNNIQACVARLQTEWGARLPHFTVSAAARDLGELIGALGPDQEPVLIFGASFGTYWANRYLQLYPAQADAVIVQGLCSPGLCDYSLSHDRAVNGLARDFFELCGADPTCNQKLGGDPWGFVGDLHARIAAGGHCPDLPADNDSLRWYISAAMFNPQARDLLPAVLYRFTRCDPGDVDAIEHYNTLAFEGVGGRSALGESSMPLRFHVAMSELIPDPPPTLEELEAGYLSYYAGADESFLFSSLFDVWPRYPRDAWSGAFAVTDIPILMLNGTLDPATPPSVAQGFAEAFTADHQHYVLLPFLSHSVVGDACAQRLIAAFAADPQGELDTSCTAELPGPNFDASPEQSLQWLGTADPWENDP